MRKLLLTMFTAMTLTLGFAEASPSPSPSPAAAAQDWPRASRSDYARSSRPYRTNYRRHRTVIVDPYGRAYGVRRRVYNNRRPGYYNSYPRRTSSERILVVPRRTSLR